MAAPVNAPAAAPAAAPRDAPRTWPVAAPPIIAPVAAPHAAPWPTGVSHELRKRALSEIPEAIRRTFVFIEWTVINDQPRAGTIVAHQSATPAERCVVWMCGDLRPYKDFVDLCVHNQSAVCNFRAIIPFMRRIW